MITINNWFKGQSTSPYTSNGAFSKCLNLDINEQPGIARIGYLPVLAGAPAALMTSYTIDTSGTSYMAGNSYAYSINTTTPAITNITGTGGTASAALDIKFWEGYLISSVGAKLRYSAIGTPSTWGDFDAVEPTILTNLATHNMFHSKWNKKLYIANGNYVACLQLESIAVFNPADNTTYIWTADAFKLPTGYTIMGISEIDNLLIISAYLSTASKTIYYFWNRADTTSEFIFELDEPGITSLIKVGRTVFATGGVRGNIYKISLYGVTPWKQIPFDYDNSEVMITNGRETTFANCDGMAWWNNKLMVGVGNNVNTGGTFNCGIYGVDGGSLNHTYTVSSGKDGLDTKVQIGAIATASDMLIYSWMTTTSVPVTAYGIDVVKFSNNRQVAASNFESLFYPVGLFNEKKSFDRVEVQLARPLQTGEGLVIKYRKNINDSWTTLGTQTFATNGAVSSLIFPGIHNAENIQIRVELTTGATSKNTPYLKEVHLI
jgi:hypothetical protein